MEYLSRREAGYGIYTEPLFLQDTCKDGVTTVVQGLVYVAENNNINEEYLGPASLDDMAMCIVSAHGSCGSSAEYVLNVAQSIRQLVPHHDDGHLFDLEKAVLELQRKRRCSLSANPVRPRRRSRLELNLHP